jgi:hypothetical protein
MQQEMHVLEQSPIETTSGHELFHNLRPTIFFIVSPAKIQ